jgi:hypothetical protein
MLQMTSEIWKESTMEFSELWAAHGPSEDRDAGRKRDRSVVEKP